MLFVLLEVRISVLNTYFYNGLYKSLQDKAVDVFWFFAGINALLVLVKITHSIVNYLITQAFEIKWLEKLNAEMLNRWLDHKNYYLLRYQQHRSTYRTRRLSIYFGHGFSGKRRTQCDCCDH